MNQMNTRELYQRHTELNDELEMLVENIPVDPDDPGYLEAAEALAEWLGVPPSDYLQFFGEQPWAQAVTLLFRNWGTSAEVEELIRLDDVSDQIGLPEFRTGVELIKQEDFDTHAMREAEGQLPYGTKLTDWPLNHIDWAEAVAQLALDYSVIEIEGETYYYQA